MLIQLVFFIRADAECHTYRLTYLAAHLLLFLARHNVNHRHNHLGYVLRAILCEAEHCVVRINAEDGTDRLKIVLPVGRVKAYGNRVDKSFKLMRGFLLANKIGKAVSIDTDTDIAL